MKCDYEHKSTCTTIAFWIGVGILVLVFGSLTAMAVLK